MIWYNELIVIPNTPAGSMIRLVGIYNQLEHRGLNPAVEIKAELSDGATSVMYSHTPSGIGHQAEPTAEDVLARYRSKLLRIIAKLQATDFTKLKFVS